MDSPNPSFETGPASPYSPNHSFESQTGSASPNSNPDSDPPSKEVMDYPSSETGFESPDLAYHSFETGFESPDLVYPSSETGFESPDLAYHSFETGFESPDLAYHSSETGFASPDLAYHSSETGPLSPDPNPDSDLPANEIMAKKRPRWEGIPETSYDMGSRDLMQKVNKITIVSDAEEMEISFICSCGKPHTVVHKFSQ